MKLIIVIQVSLIHSLRATRLRLIWFFLFRNQVLKYLLYFLPLFVSEKKGNPPQADKGFDDFVHKSFMGKWNGGDISRTIHRQYARLFVLLLLNDLNLHDGKLQIVTNSLPTVSPKQILRNPTCLIPHEHATRAKVYSSGNFSYFYLLVFLYLYDTVSSLKLHPLLVDAPITQKDTLSTNHRKFRNSCFNHKRIQILLRTNLLKFTEIGTAVRLELHLLRNIYSFKPLVALGIRLHFCASLREGIERDRANFWQMEGGGLVELLTIDHEIILKWFDFL